MLVNNNKNYLFIHIPKTAGESLTIFFLQDNAKRLLPKHASYLDAKTNLSINLDSYRIISCVRNPFDLVVSFYEHLRKPLYTPKDILIKQYPHANGLVGPVEACKLAMNLPFEKWVFEIYEKRSYLHKYFFDQSYYICDEAGELKLNYIIRFEHLDEDIVKLKETLNMNVNLKLPHKNRSNNSNYASYYNTKTRKIISRAFKVSIDYFEYSF